MNSVSLAVGLTLALLASTVTSAAGPRPLDMDAASAEVSSSYGKAHPEVQVPLTQLSPAPQALPQLPQFAGSIWTLTHWLLQISPPAQVDVQVPAEQYSPV